MFYNSEYSEEGAWQLWIFRQYQTKEVSVYVEHYTHASKVMPDTWQVSWDANIIEHIKPYRRSDRIHNLLYSKVVLKLKYGAQKRGKNRLRTATNQNAKPNECGIGNQWNYYHSKRSMNQQNNLISRPNSRHS